MRADQRRIPVGDSPGNLVHGVGLTNGSRQKSAFAGKLRDVGWKTYDAMSRIEMKMYWAVREETMLHELPWPEVDNPGSPREVRWPAEDPEACATILLAWFDAGLIAVMTTRGQEDLAASEARALLADTAAWSPSHSLVLTDLGEDLLQEAGLA